jgi:hypothetical protein
MSDVILAFDAVTDEQCRAAVGGQRLAIRRINQSDFLLDETNLVERYGTKRHRTQLNQSNAGAAHDVAKAAVRTFIAGLGDVKAVVMKEETWRYWHQENPAVAVLRSRNPRAKLWVVRKNGTIDMVG